MKKSTIRTLGALALAVFIIASVLIILGSWNSILLSSMVGDLENVANADDSVEIIETVSAYGKLNGNGNGFNYFGAVLVKADDTEALDAIIQNLKEQFDDAGYYMQKDTFVAVKYCTHERLEYESAIGEDYYTVWFYQGSHPRTNPLDIKGY